MPQFHRRLIGRLLLAVLVMCGGGWNRRASAQDAKEQQEETVENPLTGLFQRIFGVPEDADSTDAAEEEGAFRDNVDARASSSPQLTKKLALADRYIEEGDWHSAIETLQPLLTEHADTLCRDSSDGWTSLQTQVEARIGAMPQAGLEAYRSAYEGLADEMLQDEGGLSDYQACIQVASRYFHTRSGYQAANALALQHFDSGQFPQAAYWFSRLLNAPTPPSVTDTAEWRMAAAYALHRAGHQDQARELLDSLHAPDGSAGTRVRELIEEPDSQVPSTFSLLDDWPMLYGTPDHLGLAEPARPLLLKRWSVPLTARQSIRAQVDDLLLDLDLSLDLANNNLPPVPVWQPVVVDGKVAFRTMRGLAVADLASGQLLWESTDGISPERLMAGELDRGVTSGGISPIGQYGIDQQDNHQLASLLFRDGVWGLLSSDRRLLFSIEQQALMAQANYSWWWNNIRPSDEDPYRRDWSTNRLVAFDLASGHPVWEVGGRRMGEAFDPPLAGTYFFGPPVPSADQLFMMGERDGEIHLFVLKASTGELLWSLPVAGVSTEIERDWVRRSWAAQPAVDAGLVICPTTVGWLVAVDWRQQRIRWAYRYPPRTDATRSYRGMVYNSQQPLGTRWCQSAPITAAGQVLYTPTEQPDETGIDQPRLICLDCLTGALQWERPKGRGLYVAGVVGETVVIVERNSVVGVSLRDGGKELWTASLPDGAMPSGRGVLFADHLLLPVDSGELLTIGVSGGELLARQSSPDPGLLPGNLAIHAGTLVSLNPRGLDAFELRDSVEAEIAQRRRDDPGDARATLREAEVFQSTGDYEHALELLDRAGSQLRESDADLLDRHHRRTFDCLLKLCRDDPSGRSAEFERLSAIADTDLEQFDVQRLDARRRLDAGDTAGAFDVYWRLIGSPEPQFVQDGGVSCRFDMWLAGHLQEVWSAADAADRDRMDARAAQAIDDAVAADAAAQSQWERLLRFHPQTWRLTWSLIEGAIERGDFAGAEVRLRRLAGNEDSTIAAAAMDRLGRLLLDFDQPVDAAACFTRLEREYADVVLGDGRTAAAHAAEQFDSDGLSRELLDPRPVGIWSGYNFEIENRRLQFGQALVQPVTLTDDGAEFFDRHRFEYEPNTQQLVIAPAGRATPFWATPLRMTVRRRPYGQSAAVVAYGLQAVVFHQGVLHALSLPDHKVLWTRAVEETGSNYTRQVFMQPAFPMQPVSRFLDRSAVNRRSQPNGMLAHACSDYIAHYGRGEVSLLDPLTGELLWKCAGVPPRTTLFGDDEALYLTMPGGSLRVLRATDGRDLDIPDLNQLLQGAVAWRPHSAVVVERRAGDGDRNAELVVRSVDRRTSETRWSLEFDQASQLSLIDDRFLVVLEPAGDCHLVDFDTAQSVHLGTLPEDIMKAASQVQAVADSEFVYFLVDHLPNQSVYNVNSAVRVNGTVFALRREGGGIAWQQRVESQNLLLTQFEHSPLMVFLAYQTQTEQDLGFTYFHIRLLALDKQTGRLVAELKQPMPVGGSFYQMRLDMASRAFEIRWNNQLITVRAVDRLSAAE